MSKRKKLIIIIISALVFLAASISALATIISLSVRGDIEATTTTLNAEATYTSSTSDYSFTFKKAGDSKYIETSVKNNTNTDSLHVYHEITTRSGNNDLLDAILVYYNDEYVDTLSSIISNRKPISDEYMLVAPGKTISDKITFELHNSAIGGLFDQKFCNLTITTYTENMDYSKYILVTNEEEFVKAITDINSGYLDVTPTIVLGNPITVKSALTFTEPTIIQTNGYALSGNFTLDDDNTSNPDALVTILGKGTVSAITLGANYDKQGAKTLLKEYILNKTKKGVVSNASVNILGPYGFYGLSITTDTKTSYTSPNLTANIAYTEVSRITVAGDTSFDVKVLGKTAAIVEANLSHLPKANEIISSNLFLPTSIPSENATIEWKSSNEAIMSSSGKIVALGKVDSIKGEITLSATIKVNNTVTTKSYTFKVSSHSNEVNFQKLVQEMSPLIITTVDDGTDNTRYYMPTVGTNTLSEHDYRRNYTILANSDPLLTWKAYPNIDLVSLTYSMTPQADSYDYITVNGNAVYLSKNTLSNYAKVTVTGEFSDGEICESILNISIVLGSDTQLLEKAFASVDSVLNDISILGNILKTRAIDGIINEKGDFILPSTYSTNYTISYECDSEIITRIDPVVEDDITTGYKFIVNPLKFNSSETSVPIYVTVTYFREEGDPIPKTKTIYIDAPAAIHSSDCGTISIFNSLKYQTFTSIGETTNNGFNTSNGLATDNGYDYLLIRDIIGDSAYLNDYRVKNTYLTMNNITESKYQAPVTNVKLYTASENNGSITDTVAYDFAKLIEWATGNTKVTAGSVVSASSATTLGALSNYKSNGEVYLTLNEVKVIEEFYKHYTKDDGTLWNSLKSQAMETAPGRIYDNADLLVTVLRCLTNEKTTARNWYENQSNVAYGMIYAKYLEIINRYAITTSENEEPMAPAQEVYNSKFYYSFTSTAKHSMDANARTQVSFPCKYYDASGNLVSGYCNRYGQTISGQWGGSGTRQGTYAASTTKGDPDVDLYAASTTNPYDSDKTKYITSAELMVLKAFWLGALGSKNDLANNNVTHEFNSESIAAIANALAEDPENGVLPYPDYDISDFRYYGQAILNALDACLVTPTYLSSNGINLLIESFYKNFNATGYKLKEYGSTTNSPFVSTLVNAVPAVTNLDNLEGGLSYFKYLTSLDIKGNSNLYAFLGDYGLSQAFARITLTNASLTSLTMQYVSPVWNTFDLTNIKNLTHVTDIDISHNLGIKTVNPLLNIHRGNYKYVNFEDIGEVYKYNAFVIDNLASNTCRVIYTTEGGNRDEKNSGNPSLLVNLGNIGDFVSEHLFLTNVIYNDDGTTTDVCWRVEQGNEINGQEINAGGDLETINDIREMNMRVSPYFYCNQDFTFHNKTNNTEYNFIKNGLYKVIIDTNDNMIVTPLNIKNGNITYNIELVDGVPSTDFNNITGEDLKNLHTYDPHLTFSGEYSKTQTPTETTGTIYNQDSSIVSNTVNYTLRFNSYAFSFGASAYNSTNANTYYLRANNNEFICSTNTRGEDCYFVLLNQNQADFVVELRNNNFYNTTDVIMEKYGITATNNTITLGTSLPTSNTTIYGYYLYNIYTKKFVTVYGMSLEPISKFNINRSQQGLNGSGSNSVVYSFYNVDNNKYLAQTKLSTNSTTDSIRYAVGVVYYRDTANENFCASTGNYSIFRTYWTQNQNYTYQLSNTIACAEKTPTLDITSGKDLRHTARFNCVYICNGSEGASSVDYKMYDTGAFLLISNNSGIYGDNAKFCFLTEEQKDRLEEWYENPIEDITFGVGVPENHQYYYIYCPYMRRFIAGGTTDTKGEIYTTVSDFDDAQLYYVHKSKITGAGSYIIAANLIQNNPNYINRTDTGQSSNNGISGFNAFGGVTAAYYIALWKDDANTTCKFQTVAQPFEISYEVKSTSATYIAYQVDYTVTKVRAHILERDISKEYQFDKFYYLNEDMVIDGITYKAGNVIRFVCDAYYGIQYEADIEYYELTLTYYDDKDDRGSNHRFNINQFNTAEYIYYYLNQLSNVEAFEDGEITYTKLPTGTFEKYNQSATYNNHENLDGVTITFPETKWIYTSTSFDNVKMNLYLDDQGAQSAANTTYNEGTTYYKQKYVVATVFADTFEELKPTLYTDMNGTKVAANATFNPSAVYYVVGYNKINPLFLTDNIEEHYTNGDINTTIDVPVFEYYKHGIYTNNTGTRVALNASYDNNQTYYFLQGDGTYSTATPRVYSSLVSDYVSLTLNERTFEYFKHHIYSNNTGTEVSVDDQYNSDITYYQDDYVVSTFKNDVLNTYRSVLYKDEKGTLLDQEETFNPNITYYTNEFVEATVTAGTFDQMKSRLYADKYGLPLANNATYNPATRYYRKTFIVANPEPTGNLVEDWIQTKNQITRLYSHTKLTNDSNFATYVSDYSKVYSNENYPIVYKYTGTGVENIYANPTINESYEAIRTGTVTLENFAQMKSSLYLDANGTPVPADATFEQGRVYYVRTWTTAANIVYKDVSYLYNYGYYLVRLKDNALKWEADQDGVNSNTAGTMDAIIAEANTHFHDLDYNLWYGKHYAYNGFTMQSQNEILDIDGNVVHGYDKGYVYRIVVNRDNTGFIWQKVYKYYRKLGDTMVTEASTGVAQVGDTIWATSDCFGGFYTRHKFYRVVNDDFTKTLNVIQFTDVTLTNHETYTDLLNKKIEYIGKGNYLGYAGTYELIISAVIRVKKSDGTYDYTDAIRTYRIKFVGTVIN